MELIKIKTNEVGENLVSARELHQFLEIKSKFADWIKNRISKYEFVENTDFVTLSKNLENGGKETDYIIKLDMAKELSMVENNDKGRQARKYFIECEKKLKQVLSSKDTMLLNIIKSNTEYDRAIALNKYELEYVKPLEDKIEVLEPKANYVDKILKSKDCLLITQIAFDYGLSAKALNKILEEEKIQRKVNKQWVLYSKYMNQGFTSTETVDLKVKDEIKTVVNTKWTQKGRLKIHEILTKLGYTAN